MKARADGRPQPTPATRPAGRLLTTEQAAERLTITSAALRAWRHRGGGPAFYRVGGAVRYAVEDLDAWLAAQKVSS